MNSKQLLYEIQENVSNVITREGIGKTLWNELLDTHPVDIAYILKHLQKEDLKPLYESFPKQIQLDVFQEMPDKLKAFILSFLDVNEQIEVFNTLSTDDLTDLFDIFSDEELKRYLQSLNKKVREQVIEKLRFEPESAGGIMHTDVLTLMEDFTVEKSIHLLQRLRPSRDVHRTIFVTNKQHRLVGSIHLEDLVLHKPSERISVFMQKNELIANAHEDQEKIARAMVHYGVTTVPVLGDDDIFLGVIAGDTLVDVLLEEATEDVQKMAALAPLKRPYFETPFFRIMYERSYILVALLLAGSISTTIMRMYESTLTEVLLFFIPMLTSVGGNTSNQTSVVAIQGMASGEFHFGTIVHFLRREFLMGALLAIILGITAFIRAYLTNGMLGQSIVVSFTLSLIVLASTVLGSTMPFVLKRLHIDPAFSAGPFLATIMDILGTFIYCIAVKLLLF